MLVKVKGKDVVMGIDNGFLGGSDHLFDPEKIMNDPKYPAEMREDVRRAADEFRGKRHGS